MQVVASRGELPQTVAEEWFLSLSSFMCHHGFYDAAFSHMCDLFPRLCSEFPAEAISASHGAANRAKRDKETFRLLRSSVQHISKTTAASWKRYRWAWSKAGPQKDFQAHDGKKIVMFFQLALCKCPEMPWSSELWVHCFHVLMQCCCEQHLAKHKSLPAQRTKVAKSLWLFGSSRRWSLMSHSKNHKQPS